MAKLHYSDADYRRTPGAWRGLILTASDTRPGLQVQVCEPDCIRLVTNQTPILWARIEPDYYGYDLLRARRAHSWEVLPPIPFSLVEENRHPGSVESIRPWARTFAAMLAESTASPIESGRWFLGRTGASGDSSELSAELVDTIAKQRSSGRVEWDIGHDVYPITLRDLSAPESGRVKAWRKHARAGTLAPVLLHWVSGLDAFIVLDGHDRLLAASLERVSAPVLSLAAISDREVPDHSAREAVLRQVSLSLEAADRERTRPAGERTARVLRLMGAASANRLVLDAFTPRRDTGRTRARPLPGGLARWVSEVMRELEARGITDSGLLDELDGWHE